MRESPALDIFELLVRRGAEVTFTDPWVSSFSHDGHKLASVAFDEAVKTNYDCAVIATDHSSFDYKRIAAMPLVVDTRNAVKGSVGGSVHRL
jgi:UDP-N-acetyl-D-glucosamine dehydrogenase